MRIERGAARPGLRALLYSHDTFGLGHLRRSRTVATALVEGLPDASALIVTGSPIAGRFDFPPRVDHVRLPGVVKQADGRYTASSLTLDIDAMARLRGAVIEAAAAEFAPDLVIVDKEPWGFRHELAPSLARLKAQGARLVLGLRDVLDEEDALAREWERKGALEAIERLYDEIWVYGDAEVHRPLAGLGLSARMEARTVYAGYLRRESPDWPAAPEGEEPEAPYVLVTTGGGGDGAALVDWVIRAYEADARLAPLAYVVYGPFLAAHHRAEFDARVTALGGRVVAIGFTSRLERLMERAAGVVAMGGYNTFCEILSADRPAVIVPRTRPRREQLIRALAAERLGLARMLTPERDGFEAATMARAIRALADQPAPSAAGRDLLGGLDAVVARAACPRRSFAAAGE
ncbi:MAG: glycosyltransferase family protein [Paracoccaceae bacterium]